jgi:dimethylaniline monooxygenase (N-oxide forming)
VVNHGAEIKRGGIARIEGRTVQFSDGSRVEADVLVLSTGWRSRFQFLEAAHPELAATAAESWNLYRRTFAPEFGDQLAFIGFVRPNFGAMPALADLQARWAALVVSGDLSLPSRPQMEAQIDHDRRSTLQQFGSTLTKNRRTADFFMHAHTIAGEIGCRPDLRAMFFSKPRLWWKFVAGPIIGASWRYKGPDARPEYAEQVMRASPTTDFAWIYLLIHILYLWLYVVGWRILRISYFKNYLASPLSGSYTHAAALQGMKEREEQGKLQPQMAVPEGRGQ